MTTLSSRPSPISPYPRNSKVSTRQPTTPPVTFTSSPIRRTRSDSPSPTMLHPRAGQRQANSENDEDEEFPPSISQRRVPSRSAKPRRGDGRLLLPTDNGSGLKEKKSFERTRRWAEEAEEIRRVRLGREVVDVDDEDHTEGLVDDRSWDGSSSSPIPPRTPSPVSSPSAAPQLSLSISTETHAPILSIDEIIALHSASAQGAFTAAKDRARRELGLAPSPVTKIITSSQVRSSTPRAVSGREESIRAKNAPETPRRISSSPTTPFHSIPTRTSSMTSSGALNNRSVSQEPSPHPSPIRSTRAPRPDPNQASTTLPPSDDRQAQNTSQSDLPSIRSSNTPTSAPRPRPSKTRSSTAPASTAHIEQTHEMALHLRSESLNKCLTFPRPFPDRPLRVSHAEVGKSDGFPVLVFLGVGCVRYLIAMYDQLALVYGLRLICVDRWGYGKTDQVDQVDRGVVEWSGVIGQVVKSLDIRKFQVVGHSAGVPYAMAVARRYPEMIRGRLHLLAPWVGQDHDNVSKWLKWVPGGVIRTATAADHKLQTYFLGKAPRLQYAPISSTPTPISDGEEEPPIEELEESTKSTSLIRRASTVFSARSKPRSRSIYGTSASVSTVNLSLPFSGSESMRRTGSAGRASLEGGSPGTIGRSPALKNLKNLAGMRSMRNLPFGPTSYDSRGTTSTAPSSNLLATPDKSKMAISPSEVDIGLGEGFGSFATDLGLVIPTQKSGHSTRMSSDTSISVSRSTSGSGSDRRSLVGILEYIPAIPEIPTPPTQPPSPDIPSILPPSRFPSDPIFSMALSQASHAECEPGTTSDILRIVLNKPHRPYGFRYEDVIPRSHIWVGEEDKLISKESVSWMEEVCGSTVERRVGEGHNLLSSPAVLCDLFKCVGEDARAGWRLEEDERRREEEEREKERAERLREEGLRRNRRGR